jgi:transcriptional regulator with XRE-family HTH domain
MVRPDSPRVALGPEELKRRREALGLTQTALAQRIGVDHNTVCRWERGLRAITTPVLLDAALRLLEQEHRHIE